MRAGSPVGAGAHSLLQPQTMLPCVSGTHSTQLQHIHSSSYTHQLDLYHNKYHQFDSKYDSECRRVCISTLIALEILLERAECDSRAKKITINGVVTVFSFWYLSIYIFSDIELRTPPRRKFLQARQYQVQFSVGNTPRSTKQTKEKKNRASWDDNFYLCVHVQCLTLVN